MWLHHVKGVSGPVAAAAAAARPETETQTGSGRWACREERQAGREGGSLTGRVRLALPVWLLESCLVYLQHSTYVPIIIIIIKSRNSLKDSFCRNIFAGIVRQLATSLKKATELKASKES